MLYRSSYYPDAAGYFVCYCHYLQGPCFKSQTILLPKSKLLPSIQHSNFFSSRLFQTHLQYIGRVELLCFKLQQKHKIKIFVMVLQAHIPICSFTFSVFSRFFHAGHKFFCDSSLLLSVNVSNVLIFSALRSIMWYKSTQSHLHFSLQKPTTLF